MRLNLSDEPITAEVLAESLRRSGTARISVSGTSMHPTLQMGWWIYVEPARGEDLRPGAIAVFRGERFLTVHRLIWIDRDEGGVQLLFRGDYSRVHDRVPASAVIGKVVAVEIPGPQRGLERIVALEADVLSWFYRALHGLHRVLDPVLPPARTTPANPPGAWGRFARRAVAFAESVLTWFLPQRR
jgi:signal peptidase I